MRAIYYDTETTGVKPQKDRVIELAAYDPANDKSFCTLIHPGCPIPAESTAICNITDEMVKDAPPFAQVIDDFLAFCEGDVVLIAHNNDAFDRLFLAEEFQRASRTLPDWPFIDTLKWSRKYRPDLPRHSLQFLREAYKFEANTAHRALDDVIMLYKVFSQMIDDLDLETVLHLLSQKQEISRMPFGKHQGKNLSEVPKDYVEWLDKSGALEKKENADLRAAFVSLGILRQ